MGIYIHKSSDHSFSRGDGAAGPAKSISFDPTISDLDADNVQDAVDEVAGALDDKQDKLTNPLTQADVVNNLTSTAANLPLSAAMGKSLSEAKQDKLTNPLTKADVVNNLTSTAANLPLSAAMGKALLPRRWSFETHTIGRTPIQITFSNYTFISIFVANNVNGNPGNYCACATFPSYWYSPGRYIDLGGDASLRILCGNNTLELNMFIFNGTRFQDTAYIHLIAW